MGDMTNEETSDYKRYACGAIDAAATDLKALSQQIRDASRLDSDGYNPRMLLTAFLEKRNFVVDRNYLNDTGFRATLGYDLWFKRPGEGAVVVAVLCEYDALPVTGSESGNTFRTEAAVGAALGIAATMELIYDIGVLVVYGSPVGAMGEMNADFIQSGALFMDPPVSCVIVAHPMAVAQPVAVAHPTAMAHPVAVAHPTAMAHPVAVAHPTAMAHPVAVAHPVAMAQPTAMAHPVAMAQPTALAAVQVLNTIVVKVTIRDMESRSHALVGGMTAYRALLPITEQLPMEWSTRVHSDNWPEESTMWLNITQWHATIARATATEAPDDGSSTLKPVDTPVPAALLGFKQKITDCLEAVALENQCTVDIEWGKRTKSDLMFNPSFESLYKDNAEVLGLTLQHLDNFPPAGGTESGQGFHEADTLPPAGSSESGQVFHEADTLPPAGGTESGQVFHQSDTLPPGEGTKSGQRFHEANTLPPAGCTESGQVFHQSDTLSPADSTESGQVFHEADTLSPADSTESGQLFLEAPGVCRSFALGEGWLKDAKPFQIVSESATTDGLTQAKLLAMTAIDMVCSSFPRDLMLLQLQNDFHTDYIVTDV